MLIVLGLYARSTFSYSKGRFIGDIKTQSAMVHCHNKQILNKSIFLILIFCSLTGVARCQDYSAIINNLEVKTENNVYTVNADIDYRLSPLAKEAIQKGIALTWVVKITVKKKGYFWDTTIEEVERVYRIQNHALLNLYSVKKKHDWVVDMFTTLTAAFNSISKIRHIEVIKKQSISQQGDYVFSMKVLFNREALPVPLRPMSYFNSQWALSSQWSTWQLQN